MKGITVGLACCLLAAPVDAGILVLRSDQGVQFLDASAFLIGGHDKVLDAGSQPKLSGPLNKLQSIKLAGSILKDGDANALAIYQNGAPRYIVSEGLPKTAPADLAGTWTISKISYKKTEKDKVTSDVPVTDFLAYLAGGVEELAQLCGNLPELEFIGGKGKANRLQLELSAAAAKSYADDPTMLVLQRSVASAMLQRLDLFNTGVAGPDSLDQGLEFAKLSQAAYPNDPEQKRLRDELQQKRKWIDEKRAVLKALAAAKEWDAFLLGDGEMEQYRAAFADMAEQHKFALTQSLLSHKQAGEARNQEQAYAAALREFRLASMRMPSDQVLLQSVSSAWGNYSAQVAKDHQGRGKALTQGERSARDQDLQRAKLYLEAKKPDLALRQVEEAEHIDATDLSVLLRKAEVLRDLGMFKDALDSLDQYDLRAIDEERKRADDLRSEIAFRRDNTLDDLRKQLRTTVASTNYHAALAQAKQALVVNADDPEMLLIAGRLGMILRDPKFSRDSFRHYLDVTTTLDANADERFAVRQLLADVQDVKKEDGTPNWMSGHKLPPGIPYDPVSVSFQAPIDHIAASNKMTVAFEWEGNQLKSIAPSFEKQAQATPEPKLSFAYGVRDAGVTWAGVANAARPAPSADPDEAFRRSLIRFSNNPYADPVAIQKLTRKNVAIGIAGNRFFDPFVWDAVHYFQLSYDDQGRVRQAREIQSPQAAPSDQWVDFEWDGLRLVAIRAYQGPDADHRTKIYQRTMQYQNAQLTGEEVQFQGKTSKVRYTYAAGRLATATTERDPSLDDRSRTVTFR